MLELSVKLLFLEKFVKNATIFFEDLKKFSKYKKITVIK